MIDAWMRRWAPWVLMWCGWAALIVDGDVLGSHPVEWAVVFFVMLALSVFAGVTRRRDAMNLLVAAVFVIGLVQSVEYARNETWGPQGVWLVVIGAHLMAWACTPVALIHNLDCQQAPTCPRRAPTKFSIRK